MFDAILSSAHVKILYVMVIIFFNFILYAPTIFFDLVMDDLQWREKRIKGWPKQSNILKTIAERLYSGGIFGFNSKLDHFVTMCMWTILNVMIYFAFGHSPASFATALLVSCHPGMNQLSIWINGRRYLVCAILLMGIMMLWKTSSILLWGIGFALYLMSGLFQVTIFFAPILFMMKIKYVVFSIVAIFILLYSIRDWLKNKIIDRLSLIPCDDLRSWKKRRPIVIVKLFGFYFWKMIFPGHVQMIYPFLQMWGRTKEGNADAYKINGDFYRGCGAIIGMVILFSSCPIVYKPYFGFMFFSLIQWCGILPITQSTSDRYSSIPTIFMCFFISYFSMNYLPSPYSYCLLVFMGTQYLMSTIRVFRMYKNIGEWYDYHTSYDPGNLAVTNLRIGMHLGTRRLFQANALLEAAIARHPNDYALNYLGYISAMIFQNLNLAVGYIEKCKKSIYLGEEKERLQEISDAELGIRAMSGDLNMNAPQRYPKKG